MSFCFCGHGLWEAVAKYILAEHTYLFVDVVLAQPTVYKRGRR
jgi:hypothetical protein